MSSQPTPPHPNTADDGVESLALVLDLVRSGTAKTRPELGRRLGFGRTVVTQRVSQLLDAGIVDERTYAASTGGRPARELRFRAESGRLLVADIGASAFAVAITDLAGELLRIRRETCDIADGPETVLGRIETVFDELINEETPTTKLWGIGIGVPGPVEYRTGRPIAPPIMPGWDNYPIRDRLARRYAAPTWVDNDVNLMAVGEHSKGLARGHNDFLFIKIGSGIGAGLVSQGRIHRGAQGAAGDIGHVAVAEWAVCRCGNVGCLEAVAGGAALARAATDAAEHGLSPILNQLLTGKPTLDLADLDDASNRNDTFTTDLLERSGQIVGRTLSTLVNFFNPSIIVLGGQLAENNDTYCAALRNAVYARSLPLATKTLRIERSTLRDVAGLSGAAAIVIDELFSAEHLIRWIERGSPAGQPELVR